LTPRPRIHKGTRGRVEFVQDIRVSLIDVRGSVSIQFFVHKIRKCLTIRQFIIGDFPYCHVGATAFEQCLYFPFLDDSVEKQHRLNSTHLDGKGSEHQSLAKNYAANKQNNGQ
jgi:hypothetical protein